jgi:hypothetical protein
VDSIKSTVFRPTEVDEDTHPDACMDGFVFLTSGLLMNPAKHGCRDAERNSEALKIPR